MAAITKCHQPVKSDTELLSNTYIKGTNGKMPLTSCTGVAVYSLLSYLDKVRKGLQIESFISTNCFGGDLCCLHVVSWVCLCTWQIDSKVDLSIKDFHQFCC